MEFIFGDQITIDSFLGKKSIPRTNDNGWLIDILGEDYNGSEIILDSFVKADSIINDPKYKKIMCAISGGADSDVVLDICSKVDYNHKIDYVFYETGLEYNATRQWLTHLEEKYGISIIHYNAIKPIPWTCKNIGQPFLSKRVSDEIARLQRHDFQWEDEPYEILVKRYPNCQQALQWWCDAYNGGTHSSFNICRNRALKSFMIENPPWFKISPRCCEFAKKKVFTKCMKDGGYDLDIFGVRQAEKGLRATAYSNCFTEKSYHGFSEYRPLFWYSDNDKREYEQRFNIEHSCCYSEYGLLRTGCCGCPYGRDFEFELTVIEKYEPKLFIAVNNIFADSYKYTRMYREYQKNH